MTFEKSARYFLDGFLLELKTEDFLSKKFTFPFVAKLLSWRAVKITYFSWQISLKSSPSVPPKSPPDQPCRPAQQVIDSWLIRPPTLWLHPVIEFIICRTWSLSLAVGSPWGLENKQANQGSPLLKAIRALLIAHCSSGFQNVLSACFWGV